MRLHQVLQRFRNQFQSKRGYRPLKAMKRCQLRLEELEARTVPTILWSPYYGAENTNYGGGQVLGNASAPVPIYLVFWGSYWSSSAGASLAGQTESFLNNVFNNTAYLDSLHEYGIANRAYFAGAAFDYTDPNNGTASDGDIQNRVQNAIVNLGIPEPDVTTNEPIDFVITAPGVGSTVPNAGAYHSFYTSYNPFFPFDSDETVYGWIGNDGSIDTLTNYLSHETTEAMTDPQNVSFLGLTLTSGWTSTPPSAWTFGGDNELCDNEAQDYTYRLGGWLVQSHWSQGFGAYEVSDGNTQNFWISPTDSGYSYLGGTLYLYGDQFGSGSSDTISISTNGSGGVWVDMNNEIASFDNGQITSIVVYPYGGYNTINIYGTNVPITVASSSWDTVNIGLGYTQSINASVDVYNYGGAYDNVNVNDSIDSAGHTIYFYNNTIYGLDPAPIYYSQSVVNASGGSGGNTWWVYSTSGHGTYIQSGSGGTGTFNYVNVESTTRADLTVDGGSSGQAVYIGSNGYFLGGTLANINGVGVYDSNSSGYSYLYVDDSGDPTGETMNMWSAKITNTGMPGVIFWGAHGPNKGGVTSLYVYGGTGYNTDNVYYTGSGYSTEIFSGTGGANVNVNTTLGGVAIDNQGGLDVVHVGSGLLGGILGNVSAFGAGQTYLYVDDSGDPAAHTVSMYDGEITGLAPGNILWSPSSSNSGGVDYLNVQGGSGGNTFNVYGTSHFYYYTYLLSGSGGSSFNNVNIQATSGAIYADGGGDGQRVTVGSLAPSFGGTLANINGFVDVYNSASTGYSYLYADDSGDGGAKNATLYNGEISGLAPANIYWSDASPSTGYGGVDVLYVNGGSAANTFNVSNTSNFYYYTDISTGAGNDTVNVNATTGGLYIGEGTGINTVNVGNSSNRLDSIQAFVDPYGGSGNHLTINDQGSTAAFTYNIASSSVSRAGSPAAATIYYFGQASVVLNGSSGGDSFNINGTASGTSTTVNAGAGNDIFNVAAGLAGALAVNGGGGSNTLVGPNVNNTWDITSLNGGTLDGNVTFSSVQNLTGGTANDSFVFSNGAGVTGSINGGGGFDTIDYHLFATGVTVNLLAGAATGTGGVVNVHNVTGSPFNDTITGDNAGDVISLNGGKDIVKGGTGNDIFVLGATQLAGTKVTGGGGTDTLVGANTSNTWTINSAGGGNVNGKVTFTGIANLVGGPGNDTYKFSGLSPSLSGTITDATGTNKLDYSGYSGGPISANLQTSAISLVNGGAPGGFIGTFSSLAGSPNAGDTLIGANTFNSWSITGPNAGKVNTLSFTGIENLVGGTNVDVFKFSPAGTEHSINGGGGGDWLDYSGFASAVAVNLVAGSATNVNLALAGSISNIQNVHGGNAGNTLTGDAEGNILIGGLGGGAITGGTGRSLLIADKGSAHITGGSGGDILIGDYTTYDTMTTAHELALMSILAEWQSADSYATRFHDINTGTGGGLNGANKLNWGTTVKDDGASDAGFALTAAPSASALDWFFLDTNDTKVNFETGEHVNNS